MFVFTIIGTIASLSGFPKAPTSRDLDEVVKECIVFPVMGLVADSILEATFRFENCISRSSVDSFCTSSDYLKIACFACPLIYGLGRLVLPSNRRS